MGFLICCDNKGCFKNMEPMLDVNNDEVICTECGKPIKSVTSFAKIQMKSLGQIKKAPPPSQAFSVECRFCGSVAPPIKQDKQIHCASCKRHLDYLTPAFAQSFLLRS